MSHCDWSSFAIELELDVAHRGLDQYVRMCRDLVGCRAKRAAKEQNQCDQTLFHAISTQKFREEAHDTRACDGPVDGYWWRELRN
jgi:hypothetical protein